MDPLTEAEILYIKTNNLAVGAKPRSLRSMQIAMTEIASSLGKKNICLIFI